MRMSNFGRSRNFPPHAPSINVGPIGELAFSNQALRHEFRIVLRYVRFWGERSRLGCPLPCALCLRTQRSNHMAIVCLRGGTVEAGAYKNLVVLPLHTCRIQVRRAAADSVSFGGKLNGLVVSYVGEAAQAYDTQTAN